MVYSEENWPLGSLKEDLKEQVGPCITSSRAGLTIELGWQHGSCPSVETPKFRQPSRQALYSHPQLCSELHLHRTVVFGHGRHTNEEETHSAGDILCKLHVAYDGPHVQNTRRLT